MLPLSKFNSVAKKLEVKSLSVELETFLLSLVQCLTELRAKKSDCPPFLSGGSEDAIETK